METCVSTSVNCIEISSDEESSNEELVGLGSTVAVKLFEQFLLKCSLFGVQDKDVRCMRSIFKNASFHFLGGTDFVSFMRGALAKIKRENALQMVTDVDQCLRNETIQHLGHDYVSVPVTPASPNVKEHSSKFNTDIEHAKSKIIEFINKQTQKKFEDGLQSNNSDNVDDLTKSLTKNDFDTDKPVASKESDTNSENKVAQKKEYVTENRKEDKILHKKEDSLQKDARSTENFVTTSNFNDSNDIGKSTDEHCAYKIDSLEDNNDNYKNGDNDDVDDDDVVIISVIQHKSNFPHPSSITPAPSVAMPTCSARKKTIENLGEEKKEHKRQLLIKSIKQRLKFYDEEIKRLMEAELTLEEMDSADSSYVKESKLKEKYSKLFKKLCHLQGSKNIEVCDRYSRIRIEGCPYPEINREAERYVKCKKRFPDFFDIKSVVSNANKKYQLGLKSQEEVDISREVFSEIGDKLQRKRKKEFARDSGSFLTDMAKNMEDPALNDVTLKKKLKRNKKISKSNTEELFKHFTRMHYAGCDKNVISSDDEEIEKTILETQKKISPKKIKLCPTERFVKLEPSASEEDTLLQSEIEKIAEEKKILNITSNTEDNDKASERIGIEPLEWDGNSCKPKDLESTHDYTSAIKMQATKDIKGKRAQNVEHVNGDYAKLSKRKEHSPVAKNESPSAMKDFGRCNPDTETNTNFHEDKDICKNKLISNRSNNVIIVIDSDDE